MHTASDAYAGRFAGDTGAWMLDRQFELVHAALRETGASTVLDVGGGHAQLAPRLAAEGFRVTVAVSAEEALSRLRGAPVETVVAPLDDLPFESAAFDAVICVRLLCHTEGWRGLLAELARIARRGLVVDYPVRDGWQRAGPLLFSWKRRIEKTTHPWIQFTHVEIEEALALSEYVVQSREGQFALPMVLHRILKNAEVSVRCERACLRWGMMRNQAGPVVALAVPRSS
ncbi:MAG: class I SAM-dependent methyltransferase [Gemmatimonadetes bacterium]|nr:class I SAM-dependent methyltransferase [Gemmatimonadota bacterium]